MKTIINCKSTLLTGRMLIIFFIVLGDKAVGLDVEYIRFGLEMSSVPIGTVRAIDLDKNGNLWLGTSQHGLYCLTEGSWQRYDTSNSSLTSNYVYDVANDHLGNTWVSTSSSFLMFNDSASVIYDSLNSISGIITGDDGELWVSGRYQKSRKLEQGNWVIYPWREEDSTVLTELGFSNYEFTRDRHGGLWALCEENWIGGRAPMLGISQFIDNQWDFFAMLPYQAWPSSYFGGGNIVVFDSNMIFIPTSNHYMLRYKSGILDTLSFIDPDSQYTLTSNLARDRQGNIWGLTEGGLAKYSQNGWERIEANFIQNPQLDLREVYQNGFILTDSTGITLYHLGNVVSSPDVPAPPGPEEIIVKRTKSHIEIKLRHSEQVHLRIYDIHGKLYMKYSFTDTILLNNAEFLNGVYVLEFKDGGNIYTKNIFIF